jgi:hypothetical protein
MRSAGWELSPNVPDAGFPTPRERHDLGRASQILDSSTNIVASFLQLSAFRHRGRSAVLLHNQLKKQSYMNQNALARTLRNPARD